MSVPTPKSEKSEKVMFVFIIFICVGINILFIKDAFFSVGIYVCVPRGNF